jgi:hypothetical protein
MRTALLQAWLWIPVSAATVAAIVGRRRAQPQGPSCWYPSRIAIVIGALACGVAVVLLGRPVTRMLASTPLELRRLYVELAAWSPLVIGTLLGLCIGFVGQARPSLFGGRRWAFLVAWAAPAAVAILGYEITRPPW